MKTVKKLMLLISVLALWPLHADMSTSEGLPLPWPFPWAKECPVDWDGMAGKYVLTDGSMTNGHITVRISIVTKHGDRLMRVTRVGSHGEVVYDGSTTLLPDQRVVHVYLVPQDKTSDVVYATIKLFYASEEMDCTENQLVPILSIRPVNSTDPNDQVEYRLVRIE